MISGCNPLDNERVTIDRINKIEVKQNSFKSIAIKNQQTQSDQQITLSILNTQHQNNHISDCIVMQQQPSNQLPEKAVSNQQSTQQHYRQTQINTQPQTLNKISDTNLNPSIIDNYHQQTHFYQQTNNNQSYLKQILKFHQLLKPKLKKNIFSQFTTQINFNHNSNTNYQKNNNNKSSLRNNSLRNSENSKWLKSQSYAKQNQLKKSLQQSLVKSYHKHESKYFTHLQKYMKSFIQFQDKLINQPFKISLLNNFEQIKQQMQRYLQNILALQNLPINKPSYQWTQQKLTSFFTQYKPVFLARKSINTLTQKLTLKKYKNCVYFGHMINGKKQGQGIIYYFNGKVFQGNFKNDQKIFGFQIQPQYFEIYIGEFEKGMRSGIGIIKNNEYLLWGTFTKGQFKTQFLQASQINSKQQIITKKDFITRSNFNKKVKNNNLQKSSNNKEGFKLTYNSIIVYSSDIMIVKNLSNDIFIGNYNQLTQEKHGQGLEIFMNGDLYIGNYQNNTPQQYGEYYWASGAFYRGQFLSGMRHGLGKWQMLHGDSYQGEYMNDKKNGQGIYQWKNGSKYIGAFQNDYRHGYGEMQWNDGRSYKGQWINGIEKNVTIQLDNGINNRATKNKSTINTSSAIPGQKRTTVSKRYNLPSVQKKQMRSVSNPSTRNSFQSMDSSLPVRKKITLQNIKALYNPSNH